jgi:hypothetical protein
MNDQNQRWSHQYSLPNSYEELLSPPLEGLFPFADHTLKADPAVNDAAPEVRPPTTKASALRLFIAKEGKKANNFCRTKMTRMLVRLPINHGLRKLETCD